MSNPNETTPQFRTAEYAAQPGSEACKFCQQPITGNYFRVNRSMACAACAGRVKQQIPQDNHAAFTRGLAFGIGGAILGLILYAVFSIITGLMVGYVALAVGWIVGKAMMRGSGGIGGRRYQIAAVLLTYAAVSLAAIPIGIAQATKERKAARTEQTLSLQDPAQRSSSTGFTSSVEPNAARSRRPPSLEAAMVAVALVGLASPFLELQDPLHGLIGLVILFVGIQIAWKLTRGNSLQISGPFRLPSPAAQQPAAV